MAQNNVTPLHANRKILKAVNLNYVMNLRSRMTLQQVCNQLNADGFTTASGAGMHPITVAAFISSGGTRFNYTHEEREQRKAEKAAKRLAAGKPPLPVKREKKTYSNKTAKMIEKYQKMPISRKEKKVATFRDKIQNLLQMEEDDKVCKRLIAALVAE